MYAAKFSGCTCPPKLYLQHTKKQPAHHDLPKYVLEERVLVVPTVHPTVTVMTIGRRRVVPLASSGRSSLVLGGVVRGIRRGRESVMMAGYRSW
jgi:hypothetical protein